ncbi:amino acid adenylation domain-containing protein [Zooshikella marina]|uniref:non-ribosomal peptide synthetase n=1 Tax=Zooshikella ganghwensis TaxID=202772 RepID=UPI001BAEA4E6|nr:non-ribosomal peptide synthetase [Zooshikella ganghwensis]MBU2705622.1 amino acid adenylation domain-containing protein [Zooshikella ganghwensis]
MPDQQRVTYLPQQAASTELAECYVFPASSGQQRLWFLGTLDPEWLNAYLMLVKLTIEGPLNQVILQRALNEIVKRHESLRTHLTIIDDQLVQVIDPNSTVTISVLDWRLLNVGEQQQRQTYLVSELNQNVSLEQNQQLVRLVLVRQKEEQATLYISVHHALADGQSMEQLVSELLAAYQAISLDQPLPLPTLPVQFADYVSWQQTWLQTPEAKAQENYWIHLLDGASPYLNLPTDLPRPSIRSCAGRTTSFAIPESLQTQVAAFNAKHGFSNYMTLLAAYIILLHRFSGQDDFLVGVPVANRVQEELNHVIGFFANTLVVRAQLQDNLSVLELLNTIRQQTLMAMDHQQLPFDVLVNALQPERSLSYNPVFQTMFGLFAGTPVEFSCHDLQVKQQPVAYQTSKFDLSLFMFEQGQHWSGLIEYSSQLFSEDTIQQFINIYIAALSSLTVEPSSAVADLPLVSNSEDTLTFLGSGDQHEQSNEAISCFWSVIAQQKTLRPDKLALVSGSISLTYKQLVDQVEQWAAWFDAQGVRAGQRVVICLPRTPAMVIALLAVYKLGATYVPIDPDYPSARVKLTLADAAAHWLLVTSKDYESLQEINLKVNNIALVDAYDDTGGSLPTRLDTAPNISPQKVDTDELSTYSDSTSLAYLLYTSGSTGKPKGVMVTREGVNNFLSSFYRRSLVKPEDRLAAITTIAFDIAALELFLPLMCGAQIVLVAREQAGDGQALIDIIQQHHISVMQATPATWQLLADAGWLPPSSFTALCGGEALTDKLASQLLSEGAEVWNLYGPTETTIWSLCKQLQPQQKVTLGQPLSNTTFYVLDNNLYPVAPGMCGELFIGGLGLAKGYWQQPGLTARAFIPNPFNSEPGAVTEQRLYRTGDRVRRLANGELEFLGRVDEQVKLRGFRIELGEIRAILLDQPGVADAIVISSGDSNHTKRIVAYIVWSAATKLLNQDNELLLQPLFAELQKQLPGFMMPSFIIPVPSFPMTPNGKVDKQQLPSPTAYSQTVQTSTRLPSTDTQRALAAIWLGLLKCQQISIDDNFFVTGGNSLLAGQMIQAVQQRFDVALPMREVFLEPTIAHLSQAIDRLKQQAAEASAVEDPFAHLSEATVDSLLSDPLLAENMS